MAVNVDPSKKKKLRGEQIKRPSLRHMRGREGVVGCEIGVGRGLNAINILENLDIEKLYLIDPWEYYLQNNEVKPHVMQVRATGGEDQAMSVLCEYAHKIIVIRDVSHRAARYVAPVLDFVYIDGNHNPGKVMVDLELYYERVVPGGLVAGHDYTHSSNLKKSVDAFTKRVGGELHKDGCIDGGVDWWFFKRKEKTWTKELRKE